MLCTYLVKLARHLTSPHHCLTALLYFYMRACKCQLFTDEGSHRLPKRLNYCFSVLASATNRSITSVYIVQPVFYDCVDSKQILLVSFCAMTVYGSFHSYILITFVSYCELVVYYLHLCYSIVVSDHWWISIFSYAESQPQIVVCGTRWCRCQQPWQCYQCCSLWVQHNYPVRCIQCNSWLMCIQGFTK